MQFCVCMHFGNSVIQAAVEVALAGHYEKGVKAALECVARDTHVHFPYGPPIRYMLIPMRACRYACHVWAAHIRHMRRYIVEPSLLGGLSVEVDTNILDASAATTLRGLAR